MLKIIMPIIVAFLLLTNHNVMSQSNINAGCSDEDFKCLDDSLNETYQRFIKTLSTDETKELRRVQRLWIKYRDTICEFESEFYANESWFSESMKGNEKLKCLRRITKSRIQELSRYIRFKQKSNSLTFKGIINIIDDYSTNGIDGSSGKNLREIYFWVATRLDFAKQYTHYNYHDNFKKYRHDIYWLDRDSINPYGTLLVTKNVKSIRAVKDSVVLFEGDGEIGSVINSLIIASGALNIAHSRNSIIMANKNINISHDGSVEYGSFIMTPEKVDISHATGSIIYAPKGIEISHASRVKCINSTKLTKKNICSEDITTDDFLD